MTTTELCLHHWDTDERKLSTNVSSKYALTQTDYIAMCEWMTQQGRKMRVDSRVVAAAQIGTMNFQRTYGMPRHWLQAVAATSMLFYEKYEDSSVCQLSIRRIWDLSGRTFSSHVLRLIELRFVMMQFQARIAIDD